jgi:hypothetical protein
MRTKQTTRAIKQKCVAQADFMCACLLVVIRTSSKQTELPHDPTDNSGSLPCNATQSQCSKDELRKQGLKVAHYSAAEITSWAMVYLDDHAAELMPEALAQAKRMILSGAMGKRAQRALCAKLESDAQRTEA